MIFPHCLYFVEKENGKKYWRRGKVTECFDTKSQWKEKNFFYFLFIFIERWEKKKNEQISIKKNQEWNKQTRRRSKISND